jgi:hypothetical protein
MYRGRIHSYRYSYMTPLHGFQGLTLQAGEDGNSPSDTYHIGHSCVCKFLPFIVN